eukprot:m.271087 g.271087  ORF g.271087 m.271087 type:complete len:221 (+) comp50880_c0_seq1:102-764(+)
MINLVLFVIASVACDNAFISLDEQENLIINPAANKTVITDGLNMKEELMSLKALVQAQQRQLNETQAAMQIQQQALASVLAASSVAVAPGVILMWSGNVSDIPDGWTLCDGTHGAPDLRDRFVLGGGRNYSFGDQGGSADAVVVEHSHGVEDPGHSHTFPEITLASTLGGDCGYNRLCNGEGDLDSSVSTHTNVVIQSSGENGKGKNLPPFHVLAYIMKL